MPDVPASVALTTIADDTEIIASDHRNNYTALQTIVNGLRACLVGGTSGQLLTATDSDTVAWGPAAAGTEHDYAQITADVTATAITEGTATTVITGNSVTYDGTKVKVEFWCPEYYTGSAGLTVVLLRDATVIGQAGGGSAGTFEEAFKLEAFDTPTAAAHTYAVKAFSGANPTAGIVKADVGGAGKLLPAFLRVTKA